MRQGCIFLQFEYTLLSCTRCIFSSYVPKKDYEICFVWAVSKWRFLISFQLTTSYLQFYHKNQSRFWVSLFICTELKRMDNKEFCYLGTYLHIKEVLDTKRVNSANQIMTELHISKVSIISDFELSKSQRKYFQINF